MAVDIQTKLFQETASELEDIINKNPEIGQRSDLMNTFIKEKGLDPKEFYTAYKEFDDAKQAGETDFRPGIDLGESVPANIAESLINPPARFAGRVVGELARGVEDLYRYVTPDEIETEIDNKVSEVTDAVLPKQFKKDLLAILDPYHGDGTLGMVEDVGGQIASFFVPFSVISKAGTLTKAGKIGDTAADFLNKATSTKLRKGAAVGLNAAASQTFIEGTDKRKSFVYNDAYDEIMNDEDAVKALEKLQNNPEDVDSEIYLTNFLINLGIEGVAVGAFLGGKHLLKNTTSGQKITQLGRKWIDKRFGSRQGTDDKTLELVVERNFAAQKAMAEADGLASDLKKSLNANDLKGKTPEDKEVFLESVVNTALSGGKKQLNMLSPESKDIITKMRNNLDELSGKLNETVFKGKMKIKVDKKLGTYITRSYRFFDDPKYKGQILKSVNSYLNSGRAKALAKENLSDADNLTHAAYEFLRKQNPKLNEQELQQKLLELVSDKAQSVAFFDTVVTKTLSGTAKAGKKRMPVPNEIKALWGEYKDPFNNYMKTYGKLSEMKAEDDFMRGLTEHLTAEAKAGRGVLTKTPAQAIDDTGVKPTFEDIAKERARAVFHRDAAQKYLDNPDIKGLYVSKEYEDIIRNLLDEPEMKKWWSKLWATSKGITQAGKTIYNPATHGRNTMGNMALMVANGMMPIGGKGTKKAWDATWARIGKKSNEELGEYLGKMIGYGLADSSVTLNIIRKNLGRNPNTVLQKVSDNAVARLYEGEDFLFKAMHFEKTKNYLTKARKPELLKELKKSDPTLSESQLNAMVDGQIEQLAAQRTRDLMPNYNLLPKAVKKLRYMPIGDFAGFAAEIARVSKNLVKYTFDDVLSGNKELQKQAAKRLGGMTSAALLPTIIEEESAAVFGIDPEEREALSHIDKKYYTNVNRIYLSPITTNSRGRKQVERMMLGGIDPFNSIKIAARAAHQALLSEDLNPQVWSRTGLAALDSSLGPVLGTSMLTDTLLRIANGDDWAAYNENTAIGSAMRSMARTYDLDNRVTRGASMLAQTFEPGFISWVQKRANFENQMNDKGEAYSNFYTPLPTAIGKLKTGDQFLDTTIKDVGSLVGLNPSIQDISGSVRQNLGAPLRDIEDADDNFIQQISRPNITPEEFNNMYIDYINSQRDRRDGYVYLKGMLEYYNHLGFTPEDYRKGFTKTDFDRGFTNKKMGQIQNALGNRFRPSYIPNNVIGKVQQQTRGQFNFAPIFQMQRELDGSAIED